MPDEVRTIDDDATQANAADSEMLDPVEALVAENTELKDRLLRLAAEMENLRKRTEREIADTRNYAISGFARDMLVVTDNLSRALNAVPEEARQSADENVKSLIEGIEMTERETYRLLQKHGVEPIDAEGEKFDPHWHQAVFEIPNPDVPEGTVLKVMQAGFAIGGRVLRPSMVGISKGGPKTPPEPKPETAPGVEIDKQA
ncbi:MAG: nucleotide exchange factor GrpE [Alphaproteobacteria bacterium]|nr:nucleotide exchange factor GrpE [Alphaproteobacteria bacterium]